MQRTLLALPALLLLTPPSWAQVYHARVERHLVKNGGVWEYQFLSGALFQKGANGCGAWRTCLDLRIDSGLALRTCGPSKQWQQGRTVGQSAAKGSWIDFCVKGSAGECQWRCVRRFMRPMSPAAIKVATSKSAFSTSSTSISYGGSGGATQSGSVNVGTFVGQLSPGSKSQGDIRIDNVPPLSFGLLVAGTKKAETDLLGATLLIDPVSFVLTAVVQADNSGSVAFKNLPLPSSTAYLQGFFLDPARPGMLVGTARLQVP